tara:strand:- start:137 stop:466 length:330 start_codon:yes stop_codon:yes gene_type:complete
MKLFYNLINSINGIKIAFKENSFILEILAGLFLVPYIIFIDISFSFKLIIIAVYFLLLAFEIINTSIEKLCNKITKEFNHDIKEIKDLSSASVFIILTILIILILLTFF